MRTDEEIRNSIAEELKNIVRHVTSSKNGISDEKLGSIVDGWLEKNKDDLNISTTAYVNEMIKTLSDSTNLKFEELKQNGTGGVSQEQLEQTVKNEIAKVDFNTVKSPIYDTSGFSKSSIEIAQEMLIGYNIGDYMDACNCRTWAYTIPDNVLDRAKYIETLWGNVRVSKDFIKYLAEIGIQAIRLPITWMEFIDENNNLISKDWLNRAAECTAS